MYKRNYKMLTLEEQCTEILIKCLNCVVVKRPCGHFVSKCTTSSTQTLLFLGVLYFSTEARRGSGGQAKAYVYVLWGTDTFRYVRKMKSNPFCACIL